MLRRFFSQETGHPDQPDSITEIAQVANAASEKERIRIVLHALTKRLSGNVKAYTVLGTDPESYRFVTTEGYPSSLLELVVQQGPWRNPEARIISIPSQELFAPNDNDYRAKLSELGMRDIKSSMIVPLEADRSTFGAIIVDQHQEDHAFKEADLTLVKTWSSVLSQLIHQSRELKVTRLSLVEFTRTFVEAMEAQDFSQLGHAGRVAAYALAIGRTLDYNREDLRTLYFAAILHDIGKLGSGDFSEDEAHPSRGANLVASSPLLEPSAEAIRAHHEHWDGSGFPQGLQREEIPLNARIIAVADTFDLLTSERGSQLQPRQVELELEKRAAVKLDPKLTSVFINILRKGKSTVELGQVEDIDLPF